MEQSSYSPKDGFPYYFELVKPQPLSELYASNTTFEYLRSINPDMIGHRYMPDKWSIAQVIGHITDHERIKIHRAFRLSRNDKVQLWGYDQNLLVENSRFDELTLLELVHDFENVRKASRSFIDTLSQRQLNIKGWAREHEVTLEEFLKTIIGHEIHHLNILKERYLK